MRPTARDPIAVAARLAAGLAALLLVASPAQALDPTRRVAQYHHTAWTHRDGIPPSVAAIAQTLDGFLWLGSDTGLFRFDGVHAEAFGRAQTRGVAVTTLATSAEGELWAGLMDGTLARVRGE
jgi:ligand-binding sensor domain-containing protein